LLILEDIILLPNGLDEMDRKILMVLQGNARISNVDISREVGLAPSATHARIRKLESQGIVARYETRLEPKQVGLGLLAFVFVRADAPAEREMKIAATLAEMPEVLEVHHVAGGDGLLAKVRARDTESLYDIVLRRIGGVEGVENTRTVVTFKTVKETSAFALGEALEVGR
jgi:Lrp/AsnC family leucine-responsive transcriptional regulator